ncbi:MAG TPA: DUF3313 domain-containing protein [Methylomirabilota bacterium]|nr:DUF3313 domain-containing protein [Methylomirabilota bacterium]
MPLSDRVRRVARPACAVVLATALGLGGCAPKSGFSGFLGDYSKLERDAFLDNSLAYTNPTKDLKQYTKFMLDPVVVHFAADAEGVAIDPADLKMLADYWRDEAVKALSRHYTIVTEPGPGVLRVRAAITGIKKSAPLASIRPGTRTPDIGLGGASMEAEGLDAQTGERVTAVVDSRSGSVLGVTGPRQPYDDAKEIMRLWAERFVARLDIVHGRTGR